MSTNHPHKERLCVNFLLVKAAEKALERPSDSRFLLPVII